MLASDGGTVTSETPPLLAVCVHAPGPVHAVQDTRSAPPVDSRFLSPCNTSWFISFILLDQNMTTGALAY